MKHDLVTMWIFVHIFLLAAFVEKPNKLLDQLNISRISGIRPYRKSGRISGASLPVPTSNFDFKFQLKILKKWLKIISFFVWFWFRIELNCWMRTKVNPQTPFRALSPNLRTPNPGFNRGFTHPPFYVTNVGGKPRVKPGIWRPEMWALALPWT
jgi:hypothetical protein